jgi:two-component system phosphate regulon sensor histidine kinase PhoR
MENISFILNKLEDAIIVLDSDQKIVFQNSHSIDLFENNYTGQNITNLIRSPIVLETLENVYKNKKTKIIEYNSEYGQNLSPRSTNFYNVEISYEKNHLQLTNTKDNYVILMKNITPLKNIEKVRSSFIANVSHELKTPLATVMGFLETIRGPAKDDKKSMSKFLGIMDKETIRMKRLIDDLLVVSKIESDEHIHPTKKVNLIKTLNNVIESLMEYALKKNIQIRTNYQLNENLSVLGNEDELVQVFTNIIDNSIKYGKINSSIDIKAEEVKEQVDQSEDKKLFPQLILKISVKDESDGIHAKHLSRLTERFYRVDAARSKEIGGTGLGLTIVKHILNKHRGHLDIKSEINQGSTFTVELPIAPIS